MTNNQLLTTISEMFFTVSDRREFLKYINIVKNNIYNVDRKRTLVKLKKQIPENLFNIFKKIIVSNKTNSSLINDLSKLEKYLLKAPIVDLTLSYSPSKLQLEQLSRLIKNKTTNQTIINYRVDAKLGLGVIIDFEGKRLTKTIDQVLKINSTK